MEIVDPNTPVPAAPGQKLPTGWELHPGPKRTFYAATDPRDGLRTQNHPEAEDAIAEAVEIHRRNVADSDLFEEGGAEGSFAESDDETAIAAGDERSPVNAPDNTLAVVVKEPTAPARVVERQRKASFLMRQIHAAILVQAVAITRIYEEALYEELGFESWGEFCAVELNMSDRQVRKFRRIADTFQGLLPESWTNERKLTSASHLLGSGDAADRKSTSADDNAVALSSLGVERLYQLVNADDVDVSEAVSDGVVHLPDGRTLTLDEIKQRTVKELGKEFRAQKKALKERAQTLEAERDKAEAERDALRSAHETAEEKYATGLALERRWSLEQTGFEQQQKAVAEAHDAFREFRRLAGKVGVTPDSDEELRRRLWQMLNDARDLVDRLHVEYHDVIVAEIELSA